MKRFIYVSSAAPTMDMSKLSDIGAVSLENNTRHRLTGILLHIDGAFFQVIEGEADTVNMMIARIESDPRHRGMIRLADQKMRERLFHDWRLGNAVRPRSTMANFCIETPNPDSVFSRLRKTPDLDVSVFVKTFFECQSARQRIAM